MVDHIKKRAANGLVCGLLEWAIHLMIKEGKKWLGAGNDLFTRELWKKNSNKGTYGFK